MALRKYQAELIDRVRESYRQGCKAPCIVLPCGGGKSVIAAEIAKQTTRKGNKVLFLIHRKELREQIVRTFSSWGVDMELCDVMMVQTAARHSNIESPSLIITDENHHCLASSYRKIYRAFPKAYFLGITATPVRLNGDGLGDVNDRLIVGVSAKWLIENNFLAPYRYYAPSVADLSGIKIHRGEFSASDTETVLAKNTVFGDVIGHYKKLADGMQAICYCVSVKYSEKMAAGFRDKGIKARHIDGNTPMQERDEIIEAFRKKEIDILCNVDLISEGFDVPDCGCTIMLRPTQSLSLYIQQAMRCMRYKPGKTAVIIDHVANYTRFGMPDDIREWSLEKKSREKRKKEAKEPVEALQCPSCFAVIPNTHLTHCPMCGKEFPKKIRQIEEAEGELTEVTGFHTDYTKPSDCQSYRELLEYAKKAGYKKGWAYYQAKNRGFI